MLFRALSLLCLFHVACTSPNPSWIADSGSPAAGDGSASTAGDMAGSNVVDLSVVPDMAALLHPDFSQPNNPPTPDLAKPAACNTYKTKNGCKQVDECFWSGGKCRSPSDPLPNCAAHFDVQVCLLDDDCTWESHGEIEFCVNVP